MWAVEAGELEDYLARELGWPGVKQMGWVYCRRDQPELALSHRMGQGSSEQWRTWVSSLSPKQGCPQQIAQWLRGHWGIENRVFWVRDVSYGEDRSTARRIGPALAQIRNLAISVIRALGYSYIPDGRRELSARPDWGLAVLTKPPEN